MLIRPGLLDVRAQYRLELAAGHIPERTVEHDRGYRLNLHDTVSGATDISRHLDPPESCPRRCRPRAFPETRPTAPSGRSSMALGVVVEFDDAFQPVRRSTLPSGSPVRH